MKIKNDFVTNSSSTSYIVCIPDMNFFISQVEEHIKLSDRVKQILQLSINSEYIYLNEDKDEDDDLREFWKIHKVADKLGYVLMFNENGPDNYPEYINVGCKDIMKKIKKIVEE